MERYYTVSEISERTGVPRRTLYDAINAGRLEARSCRTDASAAGASRRASGSGTSARTREGAAARAGKASRGAKGNDSNGVSKECTK